MNEGNKQHLFVVPPAIVDITTLRELHYCINCVDFLTGERGTFAYDANLYSLGMGHFAISPIYLIVEDFYRWARQNGFRHVAGEMLTLRRV